MKKSLIWSWFWIFLSVVYFFLPLYATLDFSLRAQKGRLSLLAYQQVLDDPQFLSTFGFTATIAILTVVFSLLLMVPTVYWVRLRMPRLRPVVEFVTLLPFVIPAIVLVFGLIRVFSGGIIPLTNTYIGNIPIGTDILLIAGYIVLGLPYIFRSVDAGLSSIDVITLTEAAQSLGAGWGTILFRVIIPNLRSALISAAFLTMAIVIGEYTIATFLVGLKAFGPYMWQVGQNRAYQSSSLAIISFLVTWIFMGLLFIFGRRGGGQPQIAGGR
jgi:putative spermidine/putrescine transport system permease protein